jgi:hypothetical protein
LSDTFPSEHNRHSIFDGKEVAKAYVDPTAAYGAVVLDSSDVGAELLQVTAGIELRIFRQLVFTLEAEEFGGIIILNPLWY